MSHELPSTNYKERLHIALKSAKICIFEVDIPNQLYTSFENSEDIFGISEQTILMDVQPYSKLSPLAYQKAVSDYFAHPDDFEIINQAFLSIFAGKPTSYVARMKAGKSSYKWCKVDVTPIVENGETSRMIGVITDISQMKARTDELELHIKMDEFTGLYNKPYVTQLIKEELSSPTSKQKALIMLDIDNFKRINDTYGHDQGDVVLRDLAQILRKTFKHDIIGRFGGDEFILLTDLEQLEPKLQSLLHNQLPFLTYTCSIGISLFPTNATDFEPLFKMADTALYEAKKQKKSYVFYDKLT